MERKEKTKREQPTHARGNEAAKKVLEKIANSPESKIARESVFRMFREVSKTPMYNTRIAPSPTGDMHIGTARTAYFNWLAARATGGKFTLRIDDTDKERSKPEYVDVILRTMDWLGLDYDEIIYQSKRYSYYQELAQTIPHIIDMERGAILLNISEWKGLARQPEPLPAAWKDEIGGEIKISQDDLDNMHEMVLIKSDGSPTYNWATVVDDVDFGINYIIRGSDHITNTSKQVILHHLLSTYSLAFEEEIPLPKYAHLGLIGMKGKPLSKREGAASMLHYMDAGYDPDAMLNFLARMGWGPRKDDKTTKTLPRDRMLDMFLTEGTMKSSQCNLDLDKLESFDRKYKAQKGQFRTRERLIDDPTNE